jgi:hypothetical protein
MGLRTLSFSVSSNSFVCHSYENCRGVHQQFPFWNSPLAHLPLFTGADPLFFHALTKCSSSNPFLLFSLHFDGGGGVYPLSASHEPTMRFSIRQLEQHTHRSPTLFLGTRVTGHESTSHQSRITSHFPPVAALPPECYDLVFHDPC